MTLAPAPVRTASCGTKELPGEPSLPGSGGVATQRVEEVGLLHPVIDLVRDLQRFLEQRL